MNFDSNSNIAGHRGLTGYDASGKCIVAEMVREDLKSAERDELVKKHGYKTMDYHE